MRGSASVTGGLVPTASEIELVAMPVSSCSHTINWFWRWTAMAPSRGRKRATVGGSVSSFTT